MVGLLLGILNLKYKRVSQVCVCVCVCVCCTLNRCYFQLGSRPLAFSPHVSPIRVDLFLKPNTAVFYFVSWYLTLVFSSLLNHNYLFAILHFYQVPSLVSLTFLLCGYKLNLAPVNHFLLRN